MTRLELRVGDVVPNLCLVDTLGEVFAPRGRPFVIAVSSTWAPGDADVVSERALRAELRGLGVSLLVVSASGVWLLEADDPRRDLSAVDPTRDATRDVRRALGMEEIEQHGGSAFGLFVIDGKGVIRKIHREASRPRASVAVLEALRAATDTLRSQACQPLMLNRREAVIATLVAALAMLLPEGCTSPSQPTSSPMTPRPPLPTAEGGEVQVKLRINGSEHALMLEPRVTLLDALREDLGLTGTKKGCDHGQCGACTVIAGGLRINSCLALAVMYQGVDIKTIEGLARGDELHPMQAAFIEHDAFQCGYCTPGQIMSAVALLDENHAHDASEVRELMSGNICRCGAYPNIVAAIQDVQKRS